MTDVTTTTAQPPAVTRQQALKSGVAAMSDEMQHGRELGRAVTKAEGDLMAAAIALMDWGYAFMVRHAAHKNREKRYALDDAATQWFATVPKQPVDITKPRTNPVAEIVGNALYGDDDKDWHKDAAAVRRVQRYRVLLGEAWASRHEPARIMAKKSLREITAPPAPKGGKGKGGKGINPPGGSGGPPTPEAHLPETVVLTLKREHKLPPVIASEMIDAVKDVPVQWSSLAPREMASHLNEGLFILAGRYDGERLHIVLSFQPQAAE
jgi:hypothetical protein